MKCLGEIRDDFISLDMELIQIEETYTLMGKHNIDISKEEQDIVDGLRYNFSNMLRMVSHFVSFKSALLLIPLYILLTSHCALQLFYFYYTISTFLQAKQVQAIICEMQEPLRKELVEGVAILKENVINFDIDFEFNGPMVEGIPAKEASER